jgi:putative ABC transport system substrate-binding protein
VQRVVIRLALCATLLALSLPARAQPGKIYRVGYLAARTGLESEDALRHGLRDLGYIEGRNIVIESRTAEGKLDRFPELLAELISRKVDVIVVTSAQAALAAKKATQSIPIVFAIAQDPVASGLVNSLAKPGGNLTGVTDSARELAGKRLELLRETAPKVSRVALLSWKPAGPEYAAERNEIENTARTLGVLIQPLEIRGAEELESAFSAITHAGVNAFMGLTDTRLATNRNRIIEFCAKNRLPAAYQDRMFVETGGLMSYGTNRAEWRRRVAYHVDKLLNGAKPADLAVEQPTKFELVINLKTASQIGLAIPPNVLYRADKVIK